MRCVSLALLALLAACDDNASAGDSFDLLGADLPVVLPDLGPCEAVQWSGFSGASDAERRLDCSRCGCTIDPLANGLGFWAQSEAAGSVMSSATGANYLADGSSGPAFVTLSSNSPTNTFYLDGDFDLRVDYHVDALPRGGQAALRVSVKDGTFWEVARAKTLTGYDVSSAQLNGVAAAMDATASDGTLRMQRTGFTIIAEVDGLEISRTLAASAARTSLFLSAGVSGCATADAGVPDGGTCSLAVTLRNVRLASGAIVDRP